MAELRFAILGTGFWARYQPAGWHELLRHLTGQSRAETTGEDNLKTVQLVVAAYESAASGETVRLPA